MTATMWEHVSRVRGSLQGAPWRQRFTRPGPVPAWLADVVNGHAGIYAGPDPVLFRTAGIGLEWVAVWHGHRDQLELTCPHRRTPATALETAMERIRAAGGAVDADVYVWGDGTRDGAYSARVHRLFGLFPAGDIFTIGQHLEDLSDLFIITVRSRQRVVLVELTPALIRKVA